MLGEAKPFGEVVAHFGRIEQQARHSPHLHAMLWLDREAPQIQGDSIDYSAAIADFIELFATAKLPSAGLTKKENAAQPQQTLPAPAARYDHDGASELSRISNAAKRAILANPINEDGLDGSIRGSRERRNLMRVTNAHERSSYCCKSERPCKSFFPFYPQERASLAQASKMPEDSRFAPLAPRSSAFINSTHPMLPIIFHASTDVSVIFGSGVAASRYAVSYGVKLEKQQHVSDRLLEQL